jgi:hypothetical protein
MYNNLVLPLLLLCTILLGAFIYWQGGKDTRQKQNETRIEREGDIINEINSCSDLHWTKRLLCTDK